MPSKIRQIGTWILLNILGWWLSFQIGSTVSSLLVPEISQVQAFLDDVISYSLLGCFQLVMLRPYIRFHPSLWPISMGVVALLNRLFLVNLLRDAIIQFAVWVPVRTTVVMRVEEYIILGICVLMPISAFQVLILKVSRTRKVLWLCASLIMGFLYVFHFFALISPADIKAIWPLLFSFFYELVFAGAYGVLTGLVLFAVKSQPHQEKLFVSA